MSIKALLKATYATAANLIASGVSELLTCLWAPIREFIDEAALAFRDFVVTTALVLVIVGEAGYLIHLSAYLAPHWSNFVFRNEALAEAKLTQYYHRKVDEVAQARGYELKEDGPVTDVVLATISTEAVEQDVEPALARAVALQESHLNEDAESKAGAIGHMQVMPANAKRYGTTPAKLWKPKVNIKTGVAILRDCLDKTRGSYELALVCYNAGPGKLDKVIAQANSRQWAKIRPFLRKETQDYVPKVMAYYQREKNISRGA